MYQKIKAIADEALRVQNKDRMDSALHEISLLCLEQMQHVDETVIAMPMSQFGLREDAPVESDSVPVPMQDDAEGGAK